MMVIQELVDPRNPEPAVTMKTIQKQPLTSRHKRPSRVRVLRRFAEVEVFGDDGLHMVDLDMVEEVSKYRWSMNPDGYAQAWVQVEGRAMRLHRFVFGPVSKGLEIDHRDRDKRNNRRTNLRAVTHRFNKHNLVGYGKSKFKGVSQHKGRKGWRATITINRRNHHLGSFANEEDAARAYDEAARAHYGVNAIINFKNKGSKAKR